MKRILMILVVIVTINISVIQLYAFEPNFMYDPAISYDGENICFVYLNDLWQVPSSGGIAQRLTSTVGTESAPNYSKNGKYIAYDSDKDGFKAIYYIPIEGGKAKLISQEGFKFICWFSDSKHILTRKYSSGIGAAYYKLDLKGNYELITKWGGEYSGLSFDDKKIVFSVRGLPFREKYTGSVNGELWEYDIEKDQYTSITKTNFTERYPIYSANNKDIYFAASDGELFQINKIDRENFEDRKMLTKFKTWSARDLSISADDKIVFEKFNEIWKYEAKTGKSSKIEIEINEDIFETPLVIEKVHNKADNYTISDDGKLVVFSYKYNLFAIPEKGGKVIQLTFGTQVVKDIIVLNDNKTIVFSAFKDQTFKLFKLDIRDAKKIEEITWSKDKYITDLYRIDKKIGVGFSNNKRRGMLAIADSLAENFTRIINKKFIEQNVAISADEKYLLNIDRRQGIWSNKINVLNLEDLNNSTLYYYDGWIGNIFWGKDNKSIFFNQSSKLMRMDIEAKKDFYLEKNNWEPILSEKEKNEDKEIIEEIKFDKEGISERVYSIISKKGWNYVVHVKNDSTFYYINNYDKKSTLWSVNYFGKNEKKIHSFIKDPENIEYNESNNCFYFIASGVLKKLDLSSKKESIIDIDFKYSYNKNQLNKMLFDRVWCEFGRGFYDPDMQGVNWKKLYKKYSKYIDNYSSVRNLSSIIEEMIGEVNASHTGFYGRNENRYPLYSPAYLGAEFDYDKNLKKGIKITKVYRKSKLNKPFGIKPGDILISIDEEEIQGDITEQLLNKIEDKIVLMFQTKDGIKKVEMKGLSRRDNYSLYYDNWVQERRKMVNKISKNKIGYLHIQGMNYSSYQKFLQELFTTNYDKDALIIDVRNNGGGNTHDLLLEVLTKKTYSLNTHRGYDASKYEGPANSWDKPIVLLINEDSFSDAEIFPSLFKELKLGTIIGMPTSGSVIGTTPYSFRDGSSMRMPGHGWFTKDGINMEGNGAKPDIYITQTPKEKIEDDDVQLKRALQELMK